MLFSMIMPGSRSPFGYLLAVALGVAAGGGCMPDAVAQAGGDLQAQILYAFHTENVNQLATLVQTLTNRVQAEGAGSSLPYHLAHAEYRLGLLADASRPGSGAADFRDCTRQLTPALKRDPGAVEALVLQAICYDNLAQHEPFGALLDRTRARERLAAALHLEPHNPRALYVKSIGALSTAKAGSPAAEHAFAELEQAARFFESSSSTGIEVPGWGHADAYLELGRQCELRGDVLAARNWIEKALIAAPDFKAARVQLAELVRHEPGIIP